MKPFINNKYHSKSYAYLDLSKKYEDNESQLLKRERIKRKEMMKRINRQEFIDFDNKLSVEKSKIKEEHYEKTQKLKDLWAERNELIPEYFNPLYIKMNEEKAMNDALNEERKERKEINRQKKKKYGRNISQPQPNPRLMIIRIEKKNNTNGNTVKKTSSNKRMYSNEEARKNISLPIENRKVLILKKINEIKMKNYKITKPTLLMKSSKKKVQSVKPIDYLLERRKEYRRKKTDWEKELNKQQSKYSLKESIMTIHDKTALIDEKIKQKNQLLRLNGGISQNLDICDEVSYLMINSIKGKLSIIDKAISFKNKMTYLMKTNNNISSKTIINT